MVADFFFYNPAGTIFCFGPMRDNSDYPPYSYRQVVKTSFYQFFNNMDICLGNFVGKESLQYLGFIESPVMI